MNKFWHKLKIALLWGLCRSIAVLPYWFKYYVLQNIICFILRFVVRYRRRLILQQLRDSFPEKEGSEILDICRKFYMSLSESVVNMLTLAGMSDEERARRVTFEGSAEVAEIIRNRHAIALTSHYGFWEYYTFASLWLTDHHLLVAYHSIKDSAMDEFFYNVRRTKSVEPVSSNQFIRYFVNHREGIDGRPFVLGLIADQNSYPHGQVHWYRFLNHDTLFFDGGEQMALKYRMPVFYLEFDLVKRGYYHCKYHLIYDGEEKVERHEITERYVRALEQTIRRRPELWLWSHNRWKYRRFPF